MSIADRTGEQPSITREDRALQYFTDRHALIRRFVERVHAAPPPKRKQHSAQFKPKVALEAIKGIEPASALVEVAHPELSVRRQCELPGLNRYQAASETAENLHLMRLIDEQYLNWRPSTAVAR